MALKKEREPRQVLLSFVTSRWIKKPKEWNSWVGLPKELSKRQHEFQALLRLYVVSLMEKKIVDPLEGANMKNVISALSRLFVNWSHDDKLKYVEEVLKPLCCMSHLSRTLDHIVESFGLAVEQKHNVATAGASANGTMDGVRPANVQQQHANSHMPTHMKVMKFEESGRGGGGPGGGKERHRIKTQGDGASKKEASAAIAGDGVQSWKDMSRHTSISHDGVTLMNRKISSVGGARGGGQESKLRPKSSRLSLGSKSFKEMPLPKKKRCQKSTASGSSPGKSRATLIGARKDTRTLPGMSRGEVKLKESLREHNPRMPENKDAKPDYVDVESSSHHPAQNADAAACLYMNDDRSHSLVQDNRSAAESSSAEANQHSQSTKQAGEMVSSASQLLSTPARCKKAMVLVPETPETKLTGKGVATTKRPPRMSHLPPVEKFALISNLEQTCIGPDSEVQLCMRQPLCDTLAKCQSAAIADCIDPSDESSGMSQLHKGYPARASAASSPDSFRMSSYTAPSRASQNGKGSEGGKGRKEDMTKEGGARCDEGVLYAGITADGEGLPGASAGMHSTTLEDARHLELPNAALSRNAEEYYAYEQGDFVLVSTECLVRKTCKLQSNSRVIGPFEVVEVKVNRSSGNGSSPHRYKLKVPKDLRDRYGSKLSSLDASMLKLHLTRTQALPAKNRSLRNLARQDGAYIIRWVLDVENRLSADMAHTEKYALVAWEGIYDRESDKFTWELVNPEKHSGDICAAGIYEDMVCLVEFYGRQEDPWTPSLASVSQPCEKKGVLPAKMHEQKCVQHIKSSKCAQREREERRTKRNDATELSTTSIQLLSNERKSPGKDSRRKLDVGDEVLHKKDSKSRRMDKPLNPENENTESQEEHPTSKSTEDNDGKRRYQTSKSTHSEQNDGNAEHTADSAVGERGHRKRTQTERFRPGRHCVGDKGEVGEYIGCTSAAKGLSCGTASALSFSSNAIQQLQADDASSPSKRVKLSETRTPQQPTQLSLSPPSFSHSNLRSTRLLQNRHNLKTP